MDRDKEVGLVLIGNLRTPIQLNKLIRLAGIHHLDIWTILLHQSAEGQRHLQREVLLLGYSSHGTGIASTMTSIDNQRKVRLSSCAYRNGGKQHHDSQYVSKILQLLILF